MPKEFKINDKETEVEIKQGGTIGGTNVEEVLKKGVNAGKQFHFHFAENGDLKLPEDYCSGNFKLTDDGVYRTFESFSGANILPVVNFDGKWQICGYIQEIKFKNSIQENKITGEITYALFDEDIAPKLTKAPFDLNLNFINKTCRAKMLLEDIEIKELSYAFSIDDLSLEVVASFEAKSLSPLVRLV